MCKYWEIINFVFCPRGYEVYFTARKPSATPRHKSDCPGQFGQFKPTVILTRNPVTASERRGQIGGNAQRTRHKFNKVFLEAMLEHFNREGPKIIAKVAKHQMKICALLVPKEFKVGIRGSEGFKRRGARPSDCGAPRNARCLGRRERESD